MAEESRGDGSGNGQAATNDGPAFSIITQYVKDLSFENPGGPPALVDTDIAPQGDVAIQVLTRPLDGDNYEITLEFEITARREETVAFILEVAYAGVFRIRGAEGEAFNKALMVECPRLLFPFARRVVFDVVRDGGFPPLMVAPIDFNAIYQQRRTENAAADA